MPCGDYHHGVSDVEIVFAFFDVIVCFVGFNLESAEIEIVLALTVVTGDEDVVLIDPFLDNADDDLYRGSKFYTC